MPRTEGIADQEVEFPAPATLGLTRLTVTVSQREVTCSTEALLTVTDSLEPSVSSAIVNSRGRPGSGPGPGYTFERAAGAL